MGQDYTHNDRVNALIADPRYQPMILYPGRGSVNLTGIGVEESAELFAVDRKLLVFVIDGTWATARKMVRQSLNLLALPRICFSPQKPSNFRVRKQPSPHCYSTIEAIHHVIELIGPRVGFDTVDREHDRLLSVFDRMVERQLEFIEKSRGQVRSPSYHQLCRERTRA